MAESLVHNVGWYGGLYSGNSISGRSNEVAKDGPVSASLIAAHTPGIYLPTLVGSWLTPL